jgi:hypothetical protein
MGRAELAEFWNHLADRAEFLFKDSRSFDGNRHPRPTTLPSYGATQIVPAMDPLAEFLPPGMDPAAWRNAVSQTRALLLKAANSNLLTVRQLKRLRAQLDEAVARARAHPETAPDELTALRSSVIGH